MDRPVGSSREGSPAGKVSSRPDSTGRGSLSPASQNERNPQTPPPGRVTYTQSHATQTISDGDDLPDFASEVPPLQAPPPKKEVLMYSVGVQTSEPRGKDASFSDEEDGISSRNGSPRSHRRFSRKEKEREDKLRQQLREEVEEEFKSLKLSANSDEDTKENLVDKSTAQNGFFHKALTVEEMEAIVASDEFLDFFNRSGKVMERALDEENDVLVDYTIGDEDYEDDDEVGEGYGGSKIKKGRRLKEIAQFYDERWCKKRMISDINFSPKVQELPNRHKCVLMGFSFLSFLSHPTPRIHQHLKIHQDYCKYGIYMQLHDQSILFIALLTSLPPSSHRFIHR